ncbi:MAG TPA: dihydrofolate reductase family protein, partial [Burkholderiaceae bacterium]|nr:dihydrofolate reductase family protein [Burkholderiaceae bacterium]
WMASREVNEVHVEAGARLSGAFLDAGLTDELLLYTAPVLLGRGIPMAGIAPLESLAAARRFEFADLAQFGDDVRLRLRDPQRWQELVQALNLQDAGA